MARLASGDPRLPQNTPISERVYVPWSSLSPLSLVLPLMVFPFLELATVWYMMNAKSYAMGTTQWVEPFLNWLGVATIEPLQGTAALTSVDLADSMLAKQQGIRTSLVPPTPPPHTLSQHIPLHHSFQIKAPASPPAPTRQAVTLEERWGEDLWILLRICNSSTASQFTDI